VAIAPPWSPGLMTRPPRVRPKDAVPIKSPKGQPMPQ
jgi:hypothetical protein